RDAIVEGSDVEHIGSELGGHGMRGNGVLGTSHYSRDDFRTVRQAGPVNDERYVPTPAPGHGHVDAGPRAAWFDHGDGVVGRHALVAVAGDGPTQFDVPTDVLRRQLHGFSIRTAHDDRAVRVDANDRPALAVANGRPLIRGQAGIVPSSHDLVAH